MAGAVDRALRALQTNGVRRGVLGASRAWLWIAVASWGVRRLRRSNQPEVVYQARLRPGETVQVSDLAGTTRGDLEHGRRGGRRRRRRTRDA